MKKSESVSTEGKSDDDDADDDNENSCSFDTNVDEETLINSKTQYEAEFIRHHRSLFSETLSPDRDLKVDPMKILIQGVKSNDPHLYQYHPRMIPLHIREKARFLLKGLEDQGIIRKLLPHEGSKFCTQAGFVPKKSGKLRLRA